jgi:glycosyltransferase involved in cell wall biosynthesis
MSSEIVGTKQDVALSAVITCFYEEQTIAQYHERLVAALRGLGVTFEIVYVNDGSHDATFQRLTEIFDKDPEVACVMDLFANSGQLAAITAGLQETSGKVILSMDSDLQLDPAEVGLLWAKYQEGYDVVSGARTKRADSLLRIIPSKIANFIMRRASHSRLSDFGCTFKLYNGDLVRAFGFGPNKPFNPIRVVSHAGRCVEVRVSHKARSVGKSGWTFRKLWNYQMEHVVRMSEKPFQFLSAACILFAALIFLRVLAALVTDFRFIDEVTNGLLLNTQVGTTLIVLFILSVMGEFVIRVFVSAQGEPLYIVRKRLRKPGGR